MALSRLHSSAKAADIAAKLLLLIKQRVTDNHPMQSRQTLVILSLSILTAIFPRIPGLAGIRMCSFSILLELRVMEVVVKTGAIRRAKPQSNRHHQQTNTQSLTLIWSNAKNLLRQCGQNWKWRRWGRRVQRYTTHGRRHRRLIVTSAHAAAAAAGHTARLCHITHTGCFCITNTHTYTHTSSHHSQL